MKDNATTIGNLVGHAGVRDAIHVPIISAIAKTDIQPNSFVLINESHEAEAATNFDSIGVVDPFLVLPVKAGDRFWIWIRPGSIKTLTHQWTHPNIPDAPADIPDKELARIRLEEFATNALGVGLAEMLETIESCRHGGDPLYSHGYEGLGEPTGFWEDYTKFTGNPDPTKDRGFYGFFTCGGCS